MKNKCLLAVMLTLSAVLLAASGGCGSSETGGGEGAAIDAGLPGINLVSPDVSGAGEVPAFEWEAIEGADRYRLVVLDGGGAMLWAWNGADTRVNLGGVPDERPEQTPGPVITDGSQWSVVAFDAEGTPLAVSELRPVSP
ncbi:MAG: hypothetical protein ACYC4M_07585 [Thermoleophilia bacterium]